MAEKQTREEKMSVIQKKLEDGVVEIFTSEKYREYPLKNCIVHYVLLPSYIFIYMWDNPTQNPNTFEEISVRHRITHLY